MDLRIRKASQQFPTSKFLSALCLIGLLFATCQAAVVPKALFADHAVLQQGIAIPVWGAADPGESVTVELGVDTQTTKADKRGKWRVTFAAQSSIERFSR